MSDAGLGTVAIMETTGKSKTCVWRWQERFGRKATMAFCATRAGRPALRPSLRFRAGAVDHVDVSIARLHQGLK
ncbi:hypothetical protein ACVINY_003998 [Sinorhizobium meliloti]